MKANKHNELEKYMSDCKATVVDYPAKRLIGMNVLTSMRKASVDCPALWQSFGQRVSEFLVGGCKGSYGLSIMINAEDFYYWTAIDAYLLKTVPEGMKRIDIPDGQYAVCPAPNLEKVAETYMFLYETWLKGQSEYVLNEQVPCFEQYPPNWQPSDAFEIFMPVKKR